jgi:putative methylase
VRRSELIRTLSGLEGFPTANAVLEQVATPPEAAATLLGAAVARGDLEGRSILDLGSGTGVLSIGAMLLRAASVVGIEVEATAVEAADRNAARVGVEATFRVAPVAPGLPRVDTVVMNPPFGAQRRHADRPFWDAAFETSRRRIYAFALAQSRSFIEGRAVERSARVESTEPVRWELPATFPHHRKRRVGLEVDLWVVSPRESADDTP